MTIASLADAFLEQSPACNWIVDRGLIFRRVYGDPLPILGRTAADLLGRCISDVLEPECGLSWKERVERAFQGESLSLRDRHGNRSWNISVFPISSQNDICYVGALA